MSSSDSPLNKLKKSLYERGGELKKTPELPSYSGKSDKEDAAKDDWEHSHKQAISTKKHHKAALATKLLIFSIIFFAVASSIAAIIISRGSNVISSKNIDVVISGPVITDGGQDLTLLIDVTNRNSATLEGVELLVEFPEGTRNPEDNTANLLRVREPLGDIKPGGSINRTVNAAVFGEEGEQKTIKIAIEYRVPDSTASFFKETSFAIQIGSVPIGILIKIPEEVNSGQEIDAVVDIVSNSKIALENILLDIEYPTGFEFIEAGPESDIDYNTWIIGNIKPQEKKTVSIKGKITAETEEERTFVFTVGVSGDLEPNKIVTPLLSTKRTISVVKPFIDLIMTLNGDSNEVVVARSSERVRGQLTWVNNLSTPIENATVSVVLAGDSLDKSAIDVQKGFYQSRDNMIIWDKNSIPSLALVEPGERGQVSFFFSPKDDLSFGDAEISVKANIKGDRVGTSQGTTGTVIADASQSVKFLTETALKARAVYSIGPFDNSGPFPLEAEETTTFTVNWFITNSSNILSDSVVSAKLPPYVTWMDKVSPSNENITYDPSSRTVSWNAGEVKRGAGYSLPPREAAFQVAVTPSANQVGQALNIIQESVLTAQDIFTTTEIQSRYREITSSITEDPDFTPGDGNVLK